MLQLLELAGMNKLIPSPQRQAGSQSRYGNYGPAALANGTPPPSANGGPSSLAGGPSRRISGDVRAVPQMGNPQQMPTQPVRYAAACL